MTVKLRTKQKDLLNDFELVDIHSEYAIGSKYFKTLNPMFRISPEGEGLPLEMVLGRR
jgi:hypothetical protein